MQTDKSEQTLFTLVTEMTSLSFAIVTASNFNSVNSKDDYISNYSEDKAKIKLSTLKETQQSWTVHHKIQYCMVI